MGLLRQRFILFIVVVCYGLNSYDGAQTSLAEANHYPPIVWIPDFESQQISI